MTDAGANSRALVRLTLALALVLASGMPGGAQEVPAPARPTANGSAPEGLAGNAGVADRGAELRTGIAAFSAGAAARDVVDDAVPSAQTVAAFVRPRIARLSGAARALQNLVLRACAVPGSGLEGDVTAAFDALVAAAGGAIAVSFGSETNRELGEFLAVPFGSSEEHEDRLAALAVEAERVSPSVARLRGLGAAFTGLPALEAALAREDEVRCAIAPLLAAATADLAGRLEAAWSDRAGDAHWHGNEASIAGRRRLFDLLSAIATNAAGLEATIAPSIGTGAWPEIFASRERDRAHLAQFHRGTMDIAEALRLYIGEDGARAIAVERIIAALAEADVRLGVFLADHRQTGAAQAAVEAFADVEELVATTAADAFGFDRVALGADPQDASETLEGVPR